MRTSLMRWTVRFLLVAGVCMAMMTVQVRTAPVAKATATATCSMAAWYRVAGPADGPTYSGARVRAWLYAYKDINNGQFCGLLHSSIDWTQSSGHCNTFETGVYDPFTISFEAQTHKGSCSASGSLQSAFYRPSALSNCFQGGGWIGDSAGGFALTGCYHP
jgi:hypothetical protein